MYSDIHTGIGSAILTIAAIIMTIGQRIAKRRAVREAVRETVVRARHRS